jgi:hypothetical protein
MRKLWLLSMVAAMLLPSFAGAQVVTYAFRSTESENPSKAVTTNSSLNEYAQFGILSFAANLASDVTNKKCALQPFVQPTFIKAVLPILSSAVKAGFIGGELTYGDGTLTVDLTHGVIEGGILTTAEASPQTSGTSTLLTTDYENLGTQSLICGGASSTSGPGSCGTVCTSAEPDCLKEGGTIKASSSQGITTGYSEMFLYPLANSPEGLLLCSGASTLTWAECCGDPKLVVVRHVHTSLSSDHTKIFGTVTDEEAAGTFEGQQ